MTKNYETLSIKERQIVDRMLDESYNIGRTFDLPLNNSPIEMVAEALAIWVIESRNSLLNNGKIDG